MAATGKTPILLYGSTVATNTPVAGNLTNSSDGCEIAINVADKNLFFKDSTNTVNTVPIRQSNASSNGWLSSTDWSAFNGKVSSQWTTSGLNIYYNTGNVGVGTNNPQTKIHADGGVLATNSISPITGSLGVGIGTFGSAPGTTDVCLIGADAYNNYADLIIAPRNNGADVGNTVLKTGNLVIGTSGKGIDFSATAGTGTSELLADYEEGTWTPVLGGISGTSGQSYSKQVGRYTKIGRMVFFTFEATLTAKGSLSNEAIVGGLPYTIGSEIGYTSADINTFANLGQSVVDITLKANPGDTTFYVWATTAAATSSAYTISWQIYTDTTTLRGGGMYIAA